MLPQSTDPGRADRRVITTARGQRAAPQRRAAQRCSAAGKTSGAVQYRVSVSRTST